MDGPEPILPVRTHIPGDLARLGIRYRLLVLLVLARLFLFVLIYLGLLAAAACMLSRAIWPASDPTNVSEENSGGHLVMLGLRVVVGAVSALFIVFLLKGLLKRPSDTTSEYLEINDKQQPELFRFIRAVCEEVGSSFPARVFINHEVNAGVIQGTSIMNLVVPPPKHLLLGLGLVGNLNLVEFKALLAHEFGHFSQRRTLRMNSYVRVVHHAIHDLVNVRDRWDQWVLERVGTPLVSSMTATVYALVEVIRTALAGLFNWFVASNLSLSRQMEFNADLVAVSVAGSDAPIHVLLKCEFCQASLDQAAQGLALAADYKLLSRDLFVHQDQAAARLRDEQQNPDFGRPPALPENPAVSVPIFKPEDTSLVAMWFDHPPPYDREQNAKRRYFRSPRDDRPAWLLFRNAQNLREEVTRRFYTTCLHIDADAKRTDPEIVEAFLADERAVGTFDPKYQGIYDRRCLEIDDLDRLIESAANAAAPASDASSNGAEPWSALLAPWAGPDLDPKSLARRDAEVFTLHYRRAGDRRDELCRRYRFHLELEQLLKSLQTPIGAVASTYSYVASGGLIDWGTLMNLNRALQAASRELAATTPRAAAMSLPALKSMTAGEPLATYLPPLPAFPDLEAEGGRIDIARLAETNYKLQILLDRVSRIHWKSLTAILALQDQIEVEWNSKRDNRTGSISKNVLS